MRRGKPLRRTRLKRFKPLVAKTPLKAKKGLKAKSAPKKSWAAGPTRDVVDAVYERDQWSCAVCGTGVGPVRGVDHHIHHRRPRAMGGTDRTDTNLPSNLLLLCPSCHVEIESRRAQAVNAGWLVLQHQDPAETAVLLAGGRWRYLSPDGTYAPHPPRWKEGAPS